MKKYTKIILSLCLGISASLAQAYDGGAFPGYLTSPTGSSAGRGFNETTIIKTQYGECVKNQYFQPDYQREECGEIIKQEDLTISSKVLFQLSKYELSEAGKKTLANIVNNARQNGEITAVNITGYADKIGSTELNQKLSQQRADAVGDYLVTLGIDPTYIDAEGKGDINSHVSDGCFAKDGEDPTDRIDALTRDVAQATGEEKAKLDSELKALDKKLTKLANCTSPDRRVDISIITKGVAPQK